MEITIIRHMPTADNRRGILQGRRDTPILEPDADQWERIRANRKDLGQVEGYDHVLASTLKRTQMTATFYAEAHRVEPLLDELDFGTWEGRNKQRFIREHPLWIRQPARLVLGEPLAELERRVARFVDTYQTAQRVLVFSHGAWTRALLSWIDSGSINQMNRMDVPNNQLIRIRTKRAG